MMRMLSVRDVEILRALVRTQIASTASLQMGFFSGLRATQRRLRALRAMGLLMAHVKGAPPDANVRGSTYWRLTRLGLDILADRLPAERIPENAVERASQASLRFFEHRDALVELYLSLVRDRHLDATAMRARADAFAWSGDHDVELPYDAVVHAQRERRAVVPDATLASGAARIFVELDRSTESRKRCRRTAKGYADAVRQGHYAQIFRDERAPYLVYVARSALRQRSLQEAFADLQTGTLTVAVLEHREAVTWLRRALFGDADAPEATAEPGDPATPGHPQFQSAVGLIEQLYEGYLAELERQRAEGAPVHAPRWLRAAHDFLAQYRALLGTGAPS